MKKFISLVLILLLNFITVEPALADLKESQEQNPQVLSTTIEDEKVFLSPKSTYVLELESDVFLHPIRMELIKDNWNYLPFLLALYTPKGV